MPACGHSVVDRAIRSTRRLWTRCPARATWRS